MVEPIIIVTPDVHKTITLDRYVIHHCTEYLDTIDFQNRLSNAEMIG